MERGEKRENVRRKDEADFKSVDGEMRENSEEQTEEA